MSAVSEEGPQACQGACKAQRSAFGCEKAPGFVQVEISLATVFSKACLYGDPRSAGLALPWVVLSRSTQRALVGNQSKDFTHMATGRGWGSGAGVGNSRWL